MSEESFYNLQRNEKVMIFQAISNQKGMSAFAVEKDWWVSRTLEIIFKMPISKHLVFKGGTSLSKAWKLINRFSEDIDLAIDREFFEGFKGELSKSKITRLRKESGAHITGIFFNQLKDEFSKNVFNDLKYKVVETNDSDQDPRIIEIYYPNIILHPSEYVLPRVQIEIGCRSLREPFTIQSFGSLVDELYTGHNFILPKFNVPTVNPERTFLEKVFLLHEEFRRPSEKIRVDRLSRHMYDIYCLCQAGIIHNAINNKELYETIVAHRYKFARVGGINYNEHSPEIINPIPNLDKLGEWKLDYAKMVEEMIYDELKPTFEQLIDNLVELRSQLQNLNWKYELSFPD